MITNTGKDIIAKYLIGQAPAYASYMALGSGPRPLGPTYTLDSVDYAEFANKQALDFEIFRVPIVSRGYVTEDGISKVVFTAELPTEERYEITEVGVYSAKSNPSATNRDSRMIYTFTSSENWEYHSKFSAIGLGPVATGPLWGAGSYDGIIRQPAASPAPVIRATSDNAIFSAPTRLSRQERCRYLSNMIMLPGDMSYLQVDEDGVMSVKPSADNTEAGYYGSHIHLAGINLNLNSNSPEDELKLAFTVVNKNIGYDVEPSRVMIMVEFSEDDTSSGDVFARFQVNITDFSSVEAQKNRYFVDTKTLSSLVKSSNFSWGAVKLVKIYATVFEGSGPSEEPSENFYVCLDGMRLDNVSTLNPLYGLTGYSKVKTDDALPVIKDSNTSNLIEFRFGLDVL